MGDNLSVNAGGGVVDLSAVVEANGAAAAAVSSFHRPIILPPGFINGSRSNSASAWPAAVSCAVGGGDPHHHHLRVSDVAASIFNSSSPSISSGSSSDLDTESTGSFFPEKSTTLGSLIGIRAKSQNAVPSHRLMVHELMEAELSSSGYADYAGRCHPRRLTTRSLPPMPHRRRRACFTMLGCGGENEQEWGLAPISVTQMIEMERRRRCGTSEMQRMGAAMSASSASSEAGELHQFVNQEFRYGRVVMSRRSSIYDNIDDSDSKGDDDDDDDDDNDEDEDEDENEDEERSWMLGEGNSIMHTRSTKVNILASDRLAQKIDMPTTSSTSTTTSSIMHTRSTRISDQLEQKIDMPTTSSTTTTDTTTTDRLMRLVIQQTSTTGWNVFHSCPYYPFKPS